MFICADVDFSHLKWNSKKQQLRTIALEGYGDKTITEASCFNAFLSQIQTRLGTNGFT